MATTIDNNGNAVYNGYSTNLPQGSVQANQAISSGSMAPVAPVNVPPPTNVNPSTYLGATAGVATDLATGVNNLKEQQAVKDNQSNVDNTTARLLGLSGDVANTQANNVKDYGTTYQNTGVNDLYNQLQDLNAQATGLANEAKAIPIQTQQQAQGTAGTQSGVESTNRDLLASNALKALSLGQQYAIASGNYNKAKNYADQIVETKYAQQEAVINSKLTQINALDKYSLTPAEEKLRVATTTLLEKQKQEIADKKANDLAVGKLIIEASPVAPSDVLQHAKEIQAKGGSAKMLQ